ncbi:MAG: AMP-binding protein, partial [bacterium]|nr:AMP-binding protein [bacterium]
NNVDIMWMTSPMFNQIEDIENFATLKNLLVGGDVLSPPHIKRVLGAYPALNIINGYGPTENTTFSTTQLIKPFEGNKRIPIGSPIANSRAYIVDKNYNLMPEGVPGELIVGGDGIARGYLNKPELTVVRFVNDKLQATNYKQTTKNKKQITNKKQETKNNFPPNNQYPITNNQLYHTGDLCRWLPGGTIDFLGRIDRQVKIRGFRIELGEIEARLAEHEEVEEAVVIVKIESNGDKYLCAYLVAKPTKGVEKQPLSAPAVRKYLSAKLPGYMVPAYFITIDSIPLNINGKIDHKALPEPEKAKTGGRYTPPGNENQRKLVDIWAGVLNIEKERIGIEHNFFEIGGHSLKATRLVSKIHKELEVNVPLPELFKNPTIKSISAYIQNAAQSKYQGIEPVEKKDYYPISPVQKGMYILQQKKTTGTAYNITAALNLTGTIQTAKIENTFKAMIKRHESLRTHFEIQGGRLVQIVNEHVEFEMEKIEPTAERADGSVKNIIRPYKMTEAPLLRVGLIKMGEQKHRLIVDMHHIISDGKSMEL